MHPAQPRFARRGGVHNNPSLCYKLHTPSVGLESVTCVSKARIPYPYRFKMQVLKEFAWDTQQFILNLPSQEELFLKANMKNIKKNIKTT